MNTDNHHPYISFNPNHFKTLEVARSQEIELSKRYPLDIGGLKTTRYDRSSISRISMFCDLKKHDKAQSLMEEAVAYCEACLALSPGDVEIQQHTVQSSQLMMLNYISDTERRTYL